MTYYTILIFMLPAKHAKHTKTKKYWAPAPAGFDFFIEINYINTMNKNAVIRAAVVQAAPVLFNREASVEKTIGIIKETAQQGVHLILFPEAFIPAYPRGLSFGSVMGHRSTKGREL